MAQLGFLLFFRDSSVFLALSENCHVSVTVSIKRFQNSCYLGKCNLESGVYLGGGRKDSLSLICRNDLEISNYR